MPDATEKLTAAMAAGDEEAVETFYRRYFDWLYAQARRATRRDESFCLDIVQDAVLRIVRTVRTASSEAQFRAWLRLVVQTTAFDAMRNERRRRRRELAVVAVPAAAPAKDDDLFDDEHRRWLRQQVARFDPQLVRLIELRFEKRWTLSRIAALFGLSIGTIDGRIRRALKELKERAPEELND